MTSVLLQAFVNVNNFMYICALLLTQARSFAINQENIIVGIGDVKQYLPDGPRDMFLTPISNGNGALRDVNRFLHPTPIGAKLNQLVI